VAPGTNAAARPCASGQVCCAAVSSTGAEACVDTTKSVDDCGMCGRKCSTNGSTCETATCQSGMCGLTLMMIGTACDGGKCDGTGNCL
jgi:hypothetical protein